MVFTALAVGAGCGLVNGVLISYGRIVPFIATLAMLASARGLAEIISERKTQIISVPGFSDFFGARILGVEVQIYIFALVAIAGWILLNRTTFGRRTIAVGGNPEAARLAGIAVRRHTVMLYVLVGVCCAIAALMLVNRTTTGSSTHGTLYELDAIAAVVIGGTLLSGGRGTIVGTVFGVLIFTTLTNVFTLNNRSISEQALLKGVIIVVAVLLQQRLASRNTASWSRTRSTTMSHTLSTTSRTRRLGAGLTVCLAAGALAACTSNSPTESTSDGSSGDQTTAAGVANDEPGDQIVIGFSAPAADHGWMGSITESAKKEAEKYSDVELRVAEGTNDVNLQISQVETFINDKVDAIVLLPFDGAAMTPVAMKAMQAGIPVINVDREFDDPNAARVTVLGDNYGMGVSAGQYVCDQVGDNKDAVVAEIAGIDSLPLTQDRSRGFKDALQECGQDVDNRVAADFTVEGGEKAASNLLQAAPKIDAIWNHDDDQGVGVLAAIKNAGRSEFVMVGGAGSDNAMREIKDDSGVLKATVIYPSTQAADGIKMARLLVQEKAMGDLVEVAVPREVQLYAPVVTKDNVDQYLPTAFES